MGTSMAEIKQSTNSIKPIGRNTLCNVLLQYQLFDYFYFLINYLIL